MLLQQAARLGVDSADRTFHPRIPCRRKRLEKPFERFRKGLVKCRDYIFTFFEDPLIPPNNNASERGIRKLKIKLKNSEVFRSDLGADAFLDLHSVVETAKKNGQTAYNAIQALLEAAESPLVPIAE